MSASVRTVIKDSNGITFDPTALPHQYTYDSNGNMLTDTCIEQGSIVRVKTFTYVEVNSIWLKASESAWENVAESWRG